MTKRKRTLVVNAEEVVEFRPFQRTQDFIEGDPPGLQDSDFRSSNKRSRSADSIPAKGFDPRFARKCNRAADASITASTQLPVDPSAVLTCVLLRRVFFLNVEKSRYVSVGFYPAHDYLLFVEFGGSGFQPITLTEQRVTTLTEHLPKLFKAMSQ
jgi:hypothetical protein